MMWDLMESRGTPEVAQVFVLSARGRSPGHWIECVDASDPRFPRSEKWVMIVSSQFGCPAGCLFCDAGADYRGDLSVDEILGQVEWIMERHRQDGGWACPKIKLHFARMGEPALNEAVLEALYLLPFHYPDVAFLPVVATVAPRTGSCWLECLSGIKDRFFGGGRFQLQFSVHSTDESARNRIMPIQHWTMREIAQFGAAWWRSGDRKITLNFALAGGVPFDARVLIGLFDPSRFLVKITPINPTRSARHREIRSLLSLEADQRLPPPVEAAKEALESAGVEVIVSIGSAEETAIGSNCGQLVLERTGSLGVPVP